MLIKFAFLILIIAKSKCDGSTIGLSCSHPTQKLTHDVAVDYLLVIGGIRVSSSGACIDRNHPRCTSLEQVNCYTITQIVNYKHMSTCRTAITGIKIFMMLGFIINDNKLV